MATSKQITEMLKRMAADEDTIQKLSGAMQERNALADALGLARKEKEDEAPAEGEQAAAEQEQEATTEKEADITTEEVVEALGVLVKSVRDLTDEVATLKKEAAQANQAQEEKRESLADFVKSYLQPGVESASEQSSAEQQALDLLKSLQAGNPLLEKSPQQAPANQGGAEGPYAHPLFNMIESGTFDRKEGANA